MSNRSDGVLCNARVTSGIPQKSPIYTYPSSPPATYSLCILPSFDIYLCCRVCQRPTTVVPHASATATSMMDCSSVYLTGHDRENLEAWRGRVTTMRAYGPFQPSNNPIADISLSKGLLEMDISSLLPRDVSERWMIRSEVPSVSMSSEQGLGFKLTPCRRASSKVLSATHLGPATPLKQETTRAKESFTLGKTSTQLPPAGARWGLASSIGITRKQENLTIPNSTDQGRANLMLMKETA